MPDIKIFLKSAPENDAFVRVLRARAGVSKTASGAAQPLILVSDAPDRLDKPARLARLRGITTIAALVRKHEILIGPLSLPRRAGCTYCALARLRCAETDSEPEDLTDIPDDEAYLNAAADLALWEASLALAGTPEESELIGHMAFFQASSAAGVKHAFLPLPDCPVCGGDPCFRPENIPQPETLEAALKLFGGCLDSRLGIISCIRTEDPNDTGVSLPVVITAYPPRLPAGNETRLFPCGWGKGLTTIDALFSAAGETLERYSASLPDRACIRRCRMAELDGAVLAPPEFPLYSDAQYATENFPYRRFDASAVHPWVQGSMLDGSPVWLPAVLVYLSLEVTEDNLIFQGTSNGLAASTDAEDAMLRALFELVERDAFMTAWMSGTGWRRIIPDSSMNPSLFQILEELRNLGADIELYLLSTAVIGSAVLCVARGDGRSFPGATIGIGAEFDPFAALRQAVLELGQTGPYLRGLMQKADFCPPASAEDVRTMLDHAAYYFSREHAEVFNRLKTDAAPLTLRELTSMKRERSLRRAEHELKAAGIRVAFADVSSRDLKASPFYVFRAVSPDLQPITYGYGMERLPVFRARNLGTTVPMPTIHPIW